MTDRLTVDTINSDQLDALQLRAARMEHATKQYAELRVQLEDAEDRARGAERTIERVEALAYRWESALAVDKPYARSLRAALAGPKVDDSSPATPDLVHPEPKPQASEPTRVDDVTAFIDRPFRSLREKPISDRDGEPICACTYGQRCPNCRD